MTHSQTVTKNTHIVAPEIKAGFDTPNAALAEFMDMFESFKEANDRRLTELSTKFADDIVTRDKVDRINKAMDEQKRVIDQLVLKKARPALGSGQALTPDMMEHKVAFDAYIRKGDDSGLRALEAKAYSIGVNTDGGMLVPPELDTGIGRRVSVVSPMRRLATVRQISAAVLKKPFALAGLPSGWVTETAGRPQTNTQSLAELNFPTMELYAMPAATQALLDDSAVDIEAWISGEVDIVFAEQEGAAFIIGDGVAKPKGFLAYANVADTSWSWGNLGYVPTTVAGGFKAANPSDNLVDLIYALKAGYRQNANFMMNRKTQGEIRKFKDSTGNYLWQPPSGPDRQATLMGYPIAEAEEMPDIAANSLSVAIGDFRAGYLIVDRIGTRILRDPYSAKPYVLFYTTKRVGGGIQNFEAIKLLKFTVS
jgi:HK97 family phage major capsid protein